MDTELYRQAEDLVVGTQWATPGALQRRLRVSYARACQLLDQLQSNGVVGPRNGSAPRDVLR